MAALWSDPNPGGVSIAQAQAGYPLHFAAVDPRLYRNPATDYLSKLASDFPKAVADIMKQRDQDKLANQLLATATAQPATGATPEAQAAYGTGQPSAALLPQEAARNVALGFGTTAPATPDLGGMDAYKLQLAATQEQAKVEALRALTGQRIAHAASYGTGGGGGTPASPTVDPQTGLIWNGRQWIKPSPSAKAGITGADKVNKEMQGYGLSMADLDNLDISKTDIIPPKGNAGQKALIVTQDGRQATVPWQDWQRWTAVKKQGGAAPATAADGISQSAAQAAQAAPAGPPKGTKGTIKGQPVIWDGFGWVAQ